eukprot:3723198-Pyramimonas_sp.AAC.1
MPRSAMETRWRAPCSEKHCKQKLAQANERQGNAMRYNNMQTHNSVHQRNAVCGAMPLHIRRKATK